MKFHAVETWNAKSFGFYFCFFIIPIITACTTESLLDTPLNKTDGLEMAYMYSFGYDKCGEYILGERYREALFAKLESCPFTEEAKLQFYKDAASITNKALSGYTTFLFTHPLTKFSPPEAVYCERSDTRQSVKLLQNKLSEYDAGKLALADTVVNTKGTGKPLNCVELSKSGYETLGPEENGALARPHK
jgi:hypothetical protein